jgi:small subunit ribosomal protein S3
MGRKIHPKLFRLATIYTWDSTWFAGGKKFIPFLREDVLIREYLLEELKEASVDRVIIGRNSNDITVTVHSAKPGFIIGRQGAGIEELKKKLKKKFYRGRRVNVQVNIQEVSDPARSARITGLMIANEIERRMPFRRSMKMAAERVMKSGVKGVKIQVAGRLNGAEIARTEIVTRGSVPLHNLRADVNFSRITARTIYGAIGIKIWIYRGEVFGDKVKDEPATGTRHRRNRSRN